MDNCIFCQIVTGKMPCHKVFEDKHHLAFLSIYPNTEAFTVVVTKKHFPSYFADIPQNILSGLMETSARVAKLIDYAYSDVGRTGLILEGLGVNHLHAKLFPMHHTSSDKWQPHSSSINKYFEKYEGYISSHNGPRESEEKLSEVAQKIKSK